jgi:hypothetical protein
VSGDAITRIRERITEAVDGLGRSNVTPSEAAFAAGYAVAILSEIDDYLDFVQAEQT